VPELPPPPSYAPAAFGVYDEHLQDEIFLDKRDPTRSVRDLPRRSAHPDLNGDGSDGTNLSTWKSLGISNLLDHQSQTHGTEAARGTSDAFWERPSGTSSRRVAFARHALVIEFQDGQEVSCFAIFRESPGILSLSKLASNCLGATFCSQHRSEYREPTKFCRRPPVGSAKGERTDNSLELLSCLRNVVVCFSRCIYYNAAGYRYGDRLPGFLNAAMTEEFFKSSSPEEAIQTAQALAHAVGCD